MLKKSTKELGQFISISFRQEDFEEINRLAYSLEVTPSKATDLLLEFTIYKTDFLNRFVKNM